LHLLGWLAKRAMFGLWQTPANMPHTVCPSALLFCVCDLAASSLAADSLLQFNFWQTHFIINSVTGRSSTSRNFYQFTQQQMKFSRQNSSAYEYAKSKTTPKR